MFEQYVNQLANNQKSCPGYYEYKFSLLSMFLNTLALSCGLAYDLSNQS